MLFRCVALFHPSPVYKGHLFGLLLELGNNVLLERLRLGGRGPAALDLTVTTDKELLKVPLDELHAEEAGSLALEPLVERGSAVAVDLDLLHDGEADTVVDLAEVLDLVIAAGLLGTKLVAGEAEDREVVAVLLLEALVEALEAGVLRSEAALGGSVDNQNDLALVVGKGDILASLCREQCVRMELKSGW